MCLVRLICKFSEYFVIRKKSGEIIVIMATIDNNGQIEEEAKKSSSIWSNRFIIAATAQGAIVTGMTLSIVTAQLLVSGINIIQFLSLSFEGRAK
jgi:hypothetical protein